MEVELCCQIPPEHRGPIYPGYSLYIKHTNTMGNEKMLEIEGV